MSGLSDSEVERALGYTPCVCGVLDGTWHNKCSAGKTSAQLKAGHKSAMLKAREHLKTLAAAKTKAVISRTAATGKQP